ncbi:MAG: hypothetical protein LBJ00_01380 [Planctomycetaceae bacterium]|nr:hypothetical protein [Planctomycetaceae bacterium]
MKRLFKGEAYRPYRLRYLIMVTVHGDFRLIDSKRQDNGYFISTVIVFLRPARDGLL